MHDFNPRRCCCLTRIIMQIRKQQRHCVCVVAFHVIYDLKMRWLFGANACWLHSQSAAVYPYFYLFLFRISWICCLLCHRPNLTFSHRLKMWQNKSQSAKNKKVPREQTVQFQLFNTVIVHVSTEAVTQSTFMFCILQSHNWLNVLFIHMI